MLSLAVHIIGNLYYLSLSERSAGRSLESMIYAPLTPVDVSILYISVGTSRPFCTKTKGERTPLTQNIEFRDISSHQVVAPNAQD
jgi:hypothetical protein